jgi:hypothetical protein
LRPDEVCGSRGDEKASKDGSAESQFRSPRRQRTNAQRRRPKRPPFARLLFEN